MTEFEHAYAAGAQSLRRSLRGYYERYVESGDPWWLDQLARQLADDNAELRVFEAAKETVTT